MNEKHNEKHIDDDLTHLKDQVMAMMDLVRLQTEKAHRALLNYDKALAQEIIHYEARVNALELSIDKDGETLLDQHNLKDVQLRFVLAALKINTQLERIGDHAEMLARTTLALSTPFPPDLLAAVRLSDIAVLITSMTQHAIQGFNFEDSGLSRVVMTKAAELRELNANIMPTVLVYSSENVLRLEQFIYLVTYLQKLERIGELLKNIAEETIFYVDAKILRHQDK